MYLLPVEALAVSDVWIPPGKSHQDVSEFLDSLQVRGGVMLIIRKCTQEVQFDLLAGRVGFIIRHAQKVVIIILRLAVTHLLHVEVYAPGPHLGSVDMRHAASHQRLQVWRSNHLSVHGDGQVVVPLHSNRCLLVR